jgi:hypothetical protein
MLDPRTELVPNLIRGHRKDGRCQYDKAAKRELVRRCLEPGVSLAGVALAHGLNANLLRKWVDVLGGRMRPRRARSVNAAVAALLRGGRGFSDRGVSGNLPVQYSNRRTEIHEETKTEPFRGI